MKRPLQRTSLQIFFADCLRRWNADERSKVPRDR